MKDEFKVTKVEKFRVNIDSSKTSDPEEKLTKEGYEEPVIQKIKEAITEIEEVEDVERVKR